MTEAEAMREAAAQVCEVQEAMHERCADRARNAGKADAAFSNREYAAAMCADLIRAIPLPATQPPHDTPDAVRYRDHPQILALLTGFREQFDALIRANAAYDAERAKRGRL